MKKGWEVKLLGELVNIKTGKLDSNAMVDGGKYPFFTCSREIFAINDYAFDCEAILLAGNNASGDFNVKHYKGKFNAYQRTYVITAKEENRILYSYLYQQLTNHLKKFKEQSLGANTKFLKIGMIQGMEIPLPPLQEQKQIVTILDSAFSAIAKAKANAEQNLKNAKELFESYLQGVFENKGDGWEEKTLGEACEMINRGVSPKYLEKDGLCVLNQKCIRDHEINFELARYHDSISKKVNPERLIQVGDVLVNSTGTGTLGRVAMVRNIKNQATVDSHITIVRPKKELFEKVFFSYAMIYIEKELTESGEGASGQTELSRTRLRDEFKICFPTSKSLQTEYGLKMDRLTSETKKLESIYQKKIADLEELKKSLLQKAFNGELKTESACA